MSTQTSTYYDVVERLPANAVVSFANVTWDEYEDLIEQVGQASHLRINFDDGVLQAMTISWEHEKYARFFERIVTIVSLRLGIGVLSFGSATMRSTPLRKGGEPDCCFYVQNAPRIGNRTELDLEVDPPPDVAVEIDVHHDTSKKLLLYAAFGVPEVWGFDGKKLTIHLLKEGSYMNLSRAVRFLF